MGWYRLEDLDAVRRKALALLVLKRDVLFNRYNFPSRVLDFIDSGRPILISDLVSHKKHFSDRQNAFVIRDGDVEQLTAAIEMILKQPDTVREMTRRAGVLLDDRFSATQNLNRLLSSLDLLGSSSEPKSS
jgi:glycosyltransferase involved in cell wall biosynthesis